MENVLEKIFLWRVLDEVGRSIRQNRFSVSFFSLIEQGSCWLFFSFLLVSIELCSTIILSTEKQTNEIDKLVSVCISTNLIEASEPDF